MILPVGLISRRRRIFWLRSLFVFAVLIQLVGGIARAQVTVQVSAKIASVKGRALRYNNQLSYIISRGDELIPGDEIDTRGGGRVVIDLSDGSLVVIRPNSRIVINNYRAATSLRDLFRIVIGQVRVKIKHLAGKPNPYRVNSPTASILVRGTEFGVAVDYSGDTRVVVYEGLVEVESLSDPRRRVLLAPGRGALVRPNEDIRFFTPGPGSEISERGNINNGINNGGTGFADMGADPAVSSGSGIRAQLSNDYERYISSIVEPGQSSPLVRFTAFPESHFDTFDNPAYATEFTSMEGRFWLIPSFSRVLGRDKGFTFPGADSISPLDSGYLAQGDFFVPFERARAVIGGSISGSRSRLQSLTETRVIGPPIPLFFPEGVPSVLHAASSTETASVTGALMAARRFGDEGRASVGVGVDWVSGYGTLSGVTSLTNEVGMKNTEELEAATQVNRLRFLLGATYEFNGGHKLGLLYRHGLASAEDRDRSRLFNGSPPPSLDSTRQDGRSSEISVRLRGPVTRRLFYGLEGSLLRVGSEEQIRRALVVESTAHANVTRVSTGFGFGFAFRPTTVVSADLAFGLSLFRGRNHEDATGNLLEDERKRIRFASAHLGFQTDIWRQSFISASGLAIKQDHTIDLFLFPDSFNRRRTSLGLEEPDGRTRQNTSISFSDFGAGWRFNPNFLAEYIFSVNRDLGPPRHVILLRYTFKYEK